jgi:hypothetical protein
MTQENIYDILYNKLDRIQKKLNLCRFCEIEGVMTCLRDRRTDTQNGCCHACKHFRDGCRTNSLMCKMWMCRKIYNENKNKRSFQKYLLLLKKINKLIIRNNIPMCFRSNKEETFSGTGKKIVMKKRWYIDNVTLDPNWY